MNTNKVKKRLVNLEMPVHLIDRIDAASKKSGIGGRSAFIRMVVTEYLKKEEDK